MPATGVTFLVITIALLLMAVAVSLMQKRWEGHVGIGFATQMPTAELTDYIDKARKAQVVSLSIVSLSLVTWARSQTHRFWGAAGSKKSGGRARSQTHRFLGAAIG